MQLRTLIVTALVVLLGGGLAYHLLASPSKPAASNPPTSTRSASQPPTIEGADTLLNFSLKVAPGLGTWKALLACKGDQALSGSSGRPFSNPQNAQQACRNLDQLDQPPVKCAEKLPLEFRPEVRVSGDRANQPFTRRYRLSPCAEGYQAWSQLSKLWVLSNSSEAMRLVVPTKPGQVASRQQKRPETYALCEQSMAVRPMRPCYEKISGQLPHPRAVTVTTADEAKLRGASAQVILSFLARAESEPLVTGHPDLPTLEELKKQGKLGTQLKLPPGVSVGEAPTLPPVLPEAPSNPDPADVPSQVKPPPKPKTLTPEGLAASRKVQERAKKLRAKLKR